MNRNGKIILSAIVAIAAISTLFAVVPTNGTFIISFAFSVIAICGIASTVCSKAVAGLSYIYTSIVYTVVNAIFSVIACIIPLSWIWTLVVHIILLAVFAIRIIISSVGSDYVNDIDKRNEHKHDKLLKEKNNYWK